MLGANVIIQSTRRYERTSGSRSLGRSLPREISLERRSIRRPDRIFSQSGSGHFSLLPAGLLVRKRTRDPAGKSLNARALERVTHLCAAARLAEKRVMKIFAPRNKISNSCAFSASRLTPFLKSPSLIRQSKYRKFPPREPCRSKL